MCGWTERRQGDGGICTDMEEELKERRGNRQKWNWMEWMEDGEWRMESASCEQRAGWRQSAIAPLPLPLPPCLRALFLCAKWDKLNRDCSKSREISTCRKRKWKKVRRGEGRWGKWAQCSCWRLKREARSPFPLPFACLSCYRQFWMKYYDKARESREGREIVRQRRRGRG